MTEPKNLVITGASGGIGSAIARAAAAEGWGICLGYQSDADSAAALLAEIRDLGNRAIALRCDVSDEEAVARLFEDTDRMLGPLTALVNNAGVTGPIGAFRDTTPATMRRVLDINALGTMLCTQAAVRKWLGTEAPGVVINISSIAATLGAAGEYVHYAASKGAVEAFTIGLGKELAATGIRINAVSPGTVQTGIHAKAGEPTRPDRVRLRIPMGRVGEPEEIAAAVMWMLSPQASYVTGSVLRVSGGL